MRSDRPQQTSAHVVRLLAVEARGFTGGLAAFSTEVGAKCVWHPFDEFAEQADGTYTLTLLLPWHPVTLALAASSNEARRGYLTRIDLDAADDRSAESTLELTTLPTRFRLPDAVDSAGPFGLVRVGHPDWQLPEAHAAGIFLQRDSALLLGPGEYELVDPIDAATRQRFTVPGQVPVTLDLARPRSDPR